MPVLPESGRVHGRWPAVWPKLCCNATPTPNPAFGFVENVPAGISLPALTCDRCRAMMLRCTATRGRRRKNMPFTGQSLIVILLVGVIAGWLAAKIVTGGGLGIIGDLVLGILGAFLAAWLLPKLGVRLGTGIVRQIIDATLGAVILLALVRLVRRL